MTVINTNMKSLVAQNAMTVNNRSLSKAMEQLSTGKRINSAADDAAGLSISNKMTSQIRGLNQGIRNANDGISLVQTAEGATKEVTNMLQRMRELAVQASNDTYSSDDRDSMQLEVNALIDEIDRINSTTMWNGMQVFLDDGSGDVADMTDGNADGNDPYVLFAGFGGDSADTSIDTVLVQFNSVATADLGADGVDAVDVTSSDAAQEALADIDAAIVQIDSDRAAYGAAINRLTSATDNMANISLNISASRSRIEDADYAAATTELARTQIIQQAATAMLAQANQQPQNVLTLLR